MENLFKSSLLIVLLSIFSVFCMRESQEAGASAAGYSIETKPNKKKKGQAQKDDETVILRLSEEIHAAVVKNLPKVDQKKTINLKEFELKNVQAALPIIGLLAQNKDEDAWKDYNELPALQKTWEDYNKRVSKKDKVQIPEQSEVKKVIYKLGYKFIEEETKRLERQLPEIQKNVTPNQQQGSTGVWYKVKMIAYAIYNLLVGKK